MNEGTAVFYVYPCCSVHGTEVDLNTGCSQCGYKHLEPRITRFVYGPNVDVNMKYVFLNEEDAKIAKANLLIKIQNKQDTTI